MKPSGPASGLSSSIKFFPIDSKPYGSSYSEWYAKYYEWTTSIPEDENHPVFDKTGAKSVTYQTNSPVLFLPSAPNGQSIARKCTIPSNKAPLISLLFSLCDEKVDEVDFSTDAFECVEDGLRDTRITLTVDDIPFDGKLLPDINNFKVGPMFLDTTYAENNYLCDNHKPGQRYKSVIEAYTIILNPFSVGEHTIYYDVTSRGCTQGIEFHVNLQYLLEVI